MCRWVASDSNGIVTCSALKQSYRDTLTRGHTDIRRHVTFVLLHGDRELLASRMGRRSGHFMPESLLESQLATLEIPGANERCIRCDIASSLDSIVETITVNVIKQ